MNLVGSEAALDDQELALDARDLAQLQLWEQSSHGVAPRFPVRREIAKRTAQPVLPIAPVRSAITPSWISADAADADEQVDIPHDLGEHERRHLFQRHRLSRLGICVATRCIVSPT